MIGHSYGGTVVGGSEADGLDAGHSGSFDRDNIEPMYEALVGEWSR